jgi:hypothetical protein
MLLQEQSCDVPAFTYCTVLLPAATSRPPSSTPNVTPKQHGCYDFKTGTGNIKMLVKTELCAFALHPAQWKVAEIILILKPGKSSELTSYLPTSLLLTVSKGPLKKAPPNGWK